MAYPERPKFFAHKFTRLLAKSCAAQEIGPNACWLLTVIVGVEDAKHYSGPVRYWNAQLKPICGFGGNDTLVRAREAAVSAGWLHYEPGRKSKAATYWVTIPDKVRRLDDSPTDEDCDDYDDGCLPETERNNSDSFPEQDGTCDLPSRNGTQTDSKRILNGTQTDSKRESFNPVPVPNPVPKENALFPEIGEGGDSTEKVKPKAPRKTYPEAFSTFWEAYPRKSGKQNAQPAFERAIARVASDRGIAHSEAAGYLTSQAAEFAKSESGRAGKFCPHPATWLNRGNYDDGQAEWNRGGTGGSGGDRDAGRYDPQTADDDFAKFAEKVQDFTE